MSLNVFDLDETASYNVMQNVDNHESILVDRNDILQHRHLPTFQFFTDDEPMPALHGGYVRVTYDNANKSIAVWRDPTRPELQTVRLEQVPHAQAVKLPQTPKDQMSKALKESATVLRRKLARIELP